MRMIGLKMHHLGKLGLGMSCSNHIAACLKLQIRLGRARGLTDQYFALPKLAPFALQQKGTGVYRQLLCVDKWCLRSGIAATGR